MTPDRKFKLMVLVLIISILLPLIYAKSGIGEQVTLKVLDMISNASANYEIITAPTPAVTP